MIMIGLHDYLLLLATTINIASAQLVVNVKNQGGEIYKENIQANTTIDSITLDFQKTDGTSVTQFIDYKNELQVFHLVILGEQELGQPHDQALCFLLRFNKNDFISSDAMSKLRQKNPSAVRHPEEEKGLEQFEMDLLVSYEHAYVFSPYIQTMCRDARDAIYIRDKDLKLLSRSLSRDYTTLLGATKSLAVQHLTPCINTTESWRPCACHYDNCIMWYPCGLKYCKGKDSTGKTVNYRCGIKTCSKCRRFEYQSRRRELCMWELPDLTVTESQTEAEHDKSKVIPDTKKMVVNGDMLNQHIMPNNGNMMHNNDIPKNDRMQNNDNMLNSHNMPNIGDVPNNDNILKNDNMLNNGNLRNIDNVNNKDHLMNNVNVPKNYVNVLNNDNMVDEGNNMNNDNAMDPPNL